MSSESTFGQNDWLVDEMFQQYKNDPNSVDAEWRDLFEKKGVTGGSSPLASGAANSSDTSVHRARTSACLLYTSPSPRDS